MGLQPQNSGNLPMGVGAASMGLEQDASFIARTFVDVFGAGFGRDVEPTQASIKIGSCKGWLICLKAMQGSRKLVS